MGEAVHMSGQGTYGKSPYPLFNFAGNLKNKVLRNIHPSFYVKKDQNQGD